MGKRVYDDATRWRASEAERFCLKVEALRLKVQALDEKHLQLILGGLQAVRYDGPKSRGRGSHADPTAKRAEMLEQTWADLQDAKAEFKEAADLLERCAQRADDAVRADPQWWTWAPKYACCWRYVHVRYVCGDKRDPTTNGLKTAALSLLYDHLPPSERNDPPAAL